MCVSGWTCLKASSQIPAVRSGCSPRWVTAASNDEQVIIIFYLSLEKRSAEIKHFIWCKDLVSHRPPQFPHCSIFSLVSVLCAMLLSSLLSHQTFHWGEVNYISEFLFPLFACCLTRATKLNTRPGCPQRNLASNSKDFSESLAKLLGIIFLYFGALVTCCRYLFSFFLFFQPYTTLFHSSPFSAQMIHDCCHSSMALYFQTIVSAQWDTHHVWMLSQVKSDLFDRNLRL